MRLALLALLAALALCAQTTPPAINTIIKVDTDDDPSYAALAPKPAFDGQVTIWVAPLTGSTQVYVAVTVPSTAAGVPPLVGSSNVTTPQGATSSGAAKWGSMALAVPSGFLVNVTGIKVSAVGMPALLTAVALAIAR